MNEEDIRKYAELMKELELTALEITDGGKVVRLERNTTVVATPITTVSTPVTTSVTSTVQTTVNDGCIAVKSPFVGVFYSAPAENASPYVAVGDHVKKGQTLCIIEAMKTMNEITAEEDGQIEEVCAANGQVVEFGTELFRIKR